MNCSECGKAMKAELHWITHWGFGNRLVPAYHCTNKKCKEHKEYVKNKKKAKETGR